MSIEGPIGEYEPMESEHTEGTQGSPEAARRYVDFSVDDDEEELMEVETTPLDDDQPW